MNRRRGWAARLFKGEIVEQVLRLGTSGIISHRIAASCLQSAADLISQEWRNLPAYLVPQYGEHHQMIVQSGITSHV